MAKKKLRLSGAVNITRAMQVVGIVVSIIAAVTAIWLWRKQVKIEQAYRYACDYTAFEKVTEDCLEPVEVPVNRKFDVIVDQSAATGKWITRPVNTGEFVHPVHLTSEEPDRFKFSASGEPLPENVWAYYVNVTGDVLSAVSPGDLLTLSMVDPLTEQLVILLDHVEILEKNEGGVYVGAPMEQIAALEGVKLITTGEDGEDAKDTPRLVWVITQGANPDLPPLAWFSTGLNEVALKGEAN